MEGGAETAFRVPDRAGSGRARGAWGLGRVGSAINFCVSMSY